MKVYFNVKDLIKELKDCGSKEITVETLNRILKKIKTSYVI